MTIAQVIVGIEGSEHAAIALRWAAREAVLHNASLTAVLAWSFLDQHHPPDHRGFDPTYGEEAAYGALRCYLTQAAGDEGPETIEALAICDLPARALGEAAADADLLVVGARGLGSLKGLLLGSVSQHCIDHAQIPVAVVRDELPAAGGVFCAVDDTPDAIAVLEWAANEAGKRDRPLHVVHAWLPRKLDRRRLGEHEQTAREHFEAMLGAVDLLGIVVRPQMIEGTLKSVASGVAENAELLVIGRSANAGFTGRFSGSAASQVAQHGPCPVVVIPPATRRVEDVDGGSASATHGPSSTPEATAGPNASDAAEGTSA